ncbi:MAG: ribosome small subunit-dependent GTPase A [Anaerolineales bacterium]
MTKTKRGKQKKFGNLSHRDRFDEDRIDVRQVTDREQLRTRSGRWRERVNEDELPPEYNPAEWADYPLGTVLSMISGHHYVRLDETGEVIDARVRGILKHGIQNTTTVVAPGDRVHIERLEEGTGSIVALTPRKTTLSRPDPIRSHLEDVIVANVEQVIIVSSVGGPAFWPELVDRYLVFAGYYNLEPLIVINKIDQAEPGEVEAIHALYNTQLGYRVLLTSAEKGVGIEPLREAVRGRSNAIVGLSGVGKSSLLNALQPGLNLRVQSVNETYGGEGKHTTRMTTLHPLEIGGFIADTPGIRAFGLWNLTPEEVDYYFVEFRPYLGQCKFANCTHHQEPGCALRAAVEAGKIATSRFESFQTLHYETDPAHERPY